MKAKINKFFYLILVVSLFSCDNSSVVNTNDGKIGTVVFSPDGNNLLFSYFINNKGIIYESDKYGGNVGLIAESDQTLSCPQYSSDGSRILYIEFSPDRKKSSLYVINRKEPKKKLKVKEGLLITEAVFLNEGSIIAYCKAENYKSNSPIGRNAPHGMDVFLYNLNSNTETRLTSLNAYSVAYLNRISSDTVLFNVDNERICFVGINSKNEVSNFKVENPPIFLGEVTYSEQKKQIAFADSYNIYVVSFHDGKIVQKIGPNDFHISNLCFSPKQNQILYTKDLKQNKSISLLDLNDLTIQNSIITIN